MKKNAKKRTREIGGKEIRTVEEMLPFREGIGTFIARRGPRTVKVNMRDARPINNGLMIKGKGFFGPNTRVMSFSRIEEDADAVPLEGTGLIGV